MIKLILFDWDDVITLKAKEGYIACLHETLVELGVQLDPELEMQRILTTWGMTHQDDLSLLLQERPELHARACEVYEQKLFGDIFVGRLTILPGVVELLERLSGIYKLAVTTGQHHEILLNRTMPKFGIKPEWFSEIISALSDSSQSKPSPYTANRIMEHLGVTKEETIFVGDALTDVQMARNAGVEPIVVLTGHLSREQAVDLGVKWIIPDVRGIEGVLEEMVDC